MNTRIISTCGVICTAALLATNVFASTVTTLPNNTHAVHDEIATSGDISDHQSPNEDVAHAAFKEHTQTQTNEQKKGLFKKMRHAGGDVYKAVRKTTRKIHKAASDKVTASKNAITGTVKAVGAKAKAAAIHTHRTIFQRKGKGTDARQITDRRPFKTYNKNRNEQKLKKYGTFGDFKPGIIIPHDIFMLERNNLSFMKGLNNNKGIPADIYQTFQNSDRPYLAYVVFNVVIAHKERSHTYAIVQIVATTIDHKKDVGRFVLLTGPYKAITEDSFVTLRQINQFGPNDRAHYERHLPIEAQKYFKELLPYTFYQAGEYTPVTP